VVGLDLMSFKLEALERGKTLPCVPPSGATSDTVFSELPELSTNVSAYVAIKGEK
jgi:hypothetical protein